MQGSCGSNVRTGKRRKQLTMDEEATCRTGAHSLELWAGQGRVSAGVSEWTEPTNLSAFQTQKVEQNHAGQLFKIRLLYSTEYLLNKNKKVLIDNI
jgi:hypothetical protein